MVLFRENNLLMITNVNILQHYVQQHLLGYMSIKTMEIIEVQLVNKDWNKMFLGIYSFIHQKNSCLEVSLSLGHLN